MSVEYGKDNILISNLTSEKIWIIREFLVSIDIFPKQDIEPKSLVEMGVHVGVCYLCSEECNISSQICGRCARKRNCYYAS